MTPPAAAGAPTVAALLAAGTLLAFTVATLAGCGGSAPASTGHEPTGAGQAAIRRYLVEVEPLRLGVNRLLEGADPILHAFHDRRLGASVAAARIGALERRFASFAVAVAEIHPEGAELQRLHAEYAHTYVLEDAYLSALAAGLRDDRLGGLPDTQDQQRAAITGWRIGLEMLARRDRVDLPPDLQQAGRGEIAPSPAGS